MLTHDVDLMYVLVKQGVIVNGSLEYLFCHGRSICGKKMLFQMLVLKTQRNRRQWPLNDSLKRKDNGTETLINLKREKIVRWQNRISNSVF